MKKCEYMVYNGSRRRRCHNNAKYLVSGLIACTGPGWNRTEYGSAHLCTAHLKKFKEPYGGVITQDKVIMSKDSTVFPLRNSGV